MRKLEGEGALTLFRGLAMGTGKSAVKIEETDLLCPSCGGCLHYVNPNIIYNDPKAKKLACSACDFKGYHLLDATKMVDEEEYIYLNFSELYMRHYTDLYETGKSKLGELLIKMYEKQEKHVKKRLTQIRNNVYRFVRRRNDKKFKNKELAAFRKYCKKRDRLEEKDPEKKEARLKKEREYMKQYSAKKKS